MVNRFSFLPISRWIDQILLAARRLIKSAPVFVFAVVAREDELMDLVLLRGGDNAGI
jgi:hypothetical protein